MDELRFINYCGIIEKKIETNDGIKTLFLNEEGLKIYEEIGKDKFLSEMGETASKFLLE